SQSQPRNPGAAASHRPDSPSGTGLEDGLEQLPSQRPIHLGPQGAVDPRRRSLEEEYAVRGSPPRIPSDGALRRMPIEALKALAMRIQSSGGGTEIAPALVRVWQAAQRNPQFDPLDSVWAMQDTWRGDSARYAEYLSLHRSPH